MRVLIFGGRSFSKKAAFEEFLRQHLKEGDVIIHGKCPTGTDAIADSYARQNKHQVEAFPADWDKHKLAAGPIRNQQMIDIGKPDYAISTEGGKGTADMTKRLNRANIHIWRFE